MFVCVCLVLTPVITVSMCTKEPSDAQTKSVKLRGWTKRREVGQINLVQTGTESKCSLEVDKMPPL